MSREDNMRVTLGPSRHFSGPAVLGQLGRWALWAEGWGAAFEKAHFSGSCRGCCCWNREGLSPQASAVWTEAVMPAVREELHPRSP